MSMQQDQADIPACLRDVRLEANNYWHIKAVIEYELAHGYDRYAGPQCAYFAKIRVSSLIYGTYIDKIIFHAQNAEMAEMIVERKIQKEYIPYLELDDECCLLSIEKIEEIEEISEGKA